MTDFLPWKILHLDLSQAIADLASVPDCQGLYLVLWWRHIPLGHLEISSLQLPMPASQLTTLALQTITPTVGRYLLEDGFHAPITGQPPSFGDTSPKFSTLVALQQPLKQLQQQWEHSVEQKETVSVVICTRDRPEQLARCLQSLRSLVAPPHEVLVVDNAPSSDATQKLVAQLSNVRYILEPRAGLSIARNTGIRQVTGTLIAFTDDDVEVHPRWLEQLQQAFQDPQVMAVTGLIIPARLASEAEVMFQFGLIDFGKSYRPLTFDKFFFQATRPFGVPAWQIGAGATMGFRHQIFDLVGEFDPRLGAGASGCSEDSEFWYRVLAAGWKCRYQPTAVVYHYHRSDFSSLHRQMYAYMRGHVAALLVQFERHHHWGNLRRLFIELPPYYAKRLIRACLHRFQGSHSTVLTEIWGGLAGVGFYLRHRKVGTVSIMSTHQNLSESMSASPMNKLASTPQKR